MVTTKTKKRAPRKSPTKSRTKRTTAIVPRQQSKTLVTGGTGFLGAHLVRELVAAGVKNIRVMATRAAPWLGDLGVETIEGSITDQDDVARAGGVTTIVMASTSGTIAVRETSQQVTPDETAQAPLDIIARWPYYASKLYQERTAMERFNGRGQRLVILNPSLLLGPGDERLSSTKVVLDFMARKISATPSGGLSFVDVRDAAQAFLAAMKQGRHGERYLLGSANWSFEKFFGRLERLTKVRAPRLTLPTKIAVAGSQLVQAFYKQWEKASPVEPAAVEMAEYFWYLDSSKAERELGFSPRDPGETLLDTVKYVRENFLAGI
jgi:dihydroflavonol-4-reductase